MGAPHGKHAKTATAWPTKAGLNGGVEPDLGSAVIKGVTEIATAPSGSPKLIVRTDDPGEFDNLPAGYTWE